MKPITTLFAFIAALLAAGCAHVKMSAPVVVGKDYVIAAPGAYWSVDPGDLAIKATDPVSVRILEVRPPSWARVQLVGPWDNKLSGNAPFWINLQSAVSIAEIPRRK